MEKAYRAGVIVNVWLIGALCGVVLYSVILHAECDVRERRAKVAPRLAPRHAVNYLSEDTMGCYAPAAKARMLGWAE